MRLGMPASPKKCCGKNVTLNEIADSQKCHLPSVSLYMRPVHFGSQKYTPAISAQMAPGNNT